MPVSRRLTLQQTAGLCSKESGAGRAGPERCSRGEAFKAPEGDVVRAARHFAANERNARLDMALLRHGRAALGQCPGIGPFQQPCKLIGVLASASALAAAAHAGSPRRSPRLRSPHRQADKGTFQEVPDERLLGPWEIEKGRPLWPRRLDQPSERSQSRAGDFARCTTRRAEVAPSTRPAAMSDDATSPG